MSKKYLLLNKNNDKDTIAISTKVIETIVENVLSETKGVELSDESFGNNGIDCFVRDRQLNLLVKVKVAYGSNVGSICENIQGLVKEEVMQITGIICNNINVEVTGFII